MIPGFTHTVPGQRHRDPGERQHILHFPSLQTEGPPQKGLKRQANRSFAYSSTSGSNIRDLVWFQEAAPAWGVGRGPARPARLGLVDRPAGRRHSSQR
jgi:hypothetical protein